MDSATELGITKWEALRSAISTFLFDPASAGSSVGINFLPHIHEEVSRYCLRDEHCNSAGSCKPLGMCRPSETSICQSDKQCFAEGDSCDRMGQCEVSLEVFCQLEQKSCGALGACEPAGFCENRTGCAPADYRITTLGELPDHGWTIMYALDARLLEGFTPTLPALSGVVGSASDWVAAHPREKTVVVLATDGLPTACDPSLPTEGVPGAIDNLVSIAEYGVGHGVETFVIGVFSPEEKPYVAHNLDAIAAGGATKEAFVITTDEEMAEQLLRALNEVRMANLCEYALPEHSDSLDLTQLLVRITPQDGGSTLWLDYRTSIDRCGPEHNGSSPDGMPVAGGFYFDRDPEGPVAPGRIILCPEICAMQLPPDMISVTCRGQTEQGAGGMGS